MEKLKFRTLKANEIDCRISTVNESGVMLLLYKDARVDQNILDESVGPMGWQRHHSRENANCIVAIWDDDKKQWIEKEDTGTESYTEKEKGLASDSFKRACFNWGIGRELYTAPYIWITRQDCKIVKEQKSGKCTCYDKFAVKTIGYDEERNINQLVIINVKSRKVVYKLGQRQAEEKEPEQEIPPITEAQINTIFFELSRTGIGLKRILKEYKVDDIHEMNVKQFVNAMDILKKKPDKPMDPDPSTVPPEGDSGLPFSR